LLLISKLLPLSDNADVVPDATLLINSGSVAERRDNIIISLAKCWVILGSNLAPESGYFLISFHGSLQ
jgi:hypothetical protein